MSKQGQSVENIVNLRGGLPRLNKKLSSGESIVVAFLGGSITEGYGASDPDTTSWRALIGNRLKEQFGEAKVTCINAGVGGTTSTLGAHRLREHVLHKGEIDLLFVEFSVNDGEDRGESIRGTEGIVRQCRRLSPHADICFLYTAADKNLSAELPFNIAVHEEVASHYDLPSVNFAAGVYERIAAGQVRWEELAPDRVHPNDAGYALYAEYLQSSLEIALDQNAAHAARPASMDLPAPLDDRNYEHAAMRDFRQAAWQEDFTVKELQQEPLINWRYNTEHLYTDNQEAALSFTASGRSAGLLLLCGPDTGIFEYSLDGLTFHQVNLFDDWCLGAFRPVIAMIPLPSGIQSVQIIVRNTGLKDERSKGTTLRVLKVLSS